MLAAKTQASSPPVDLPQAQDDEAVGRILSELDALSENWVVDNRMSRIAAALAVAPVEKRAEAILAMLQLAYSEGYYAAALTALRNHEGRKG